MIFYVTERLKMDKETIKEWAEKIDAEGKNFYSPHEDYTDKDGQRRCFKCFVNDGIVCDEKWKTEGNPRILVILREPREQFDPDCKRSDIGDNIYDLTEYLKKTNDRYGYEWNMPHSTYRPLKEWIDTIFKKYGYAVPNNDNIFEHVAVINLKKTPGGSSCNRNKLKDFCSDEKNKMFLREQIDKIDPNIIILSNEWANFCTIMGVNPRPTPFEVRHDGINPLNVYDCKLPMPRGKALVFDAYHPSARGKYLTLAVDFINVPNKYYNSYGNSQSR